MRKGIGYYGGIYYQEVILEHHPKGWAAAFLWGADGWRTPEPIIRKLSMTGKCPVIEIHGIWDDDHYFDKSDIRRAVVIAHKVAALDRDYPDVRFLFSPWLEHRAGHHLWRQCKRACKEVLPKSVKIVCSGPRTSKGIWEVHHGLPTLRKHIYSYDGADILNYSHTQVQHTMQQHSNAKIFFAWCPACNGKKYLSDKTPRSKRTHWLTGGHIKQIKRLMRG